MAWKDGWPICDNCGINIGYEAVFSMNRRDYCVWCQPPAGESIDSGCADCVKMRKCSHQLESGSHGFGCDRCGMSGVAGVAWCRQGHGRERLK